VNAPAFPFSSGNRLAPAPEFAERRRTCPFGTVTLPSGDEAILLVRHEDVAAAAAEPRLSRNHVLPDAPRNSAEPNFLYDPELLINQADEAHDRVHRIATQALNNTRVARYVPVVERVAGGLLDAMGPTADLVEEYCSQLPLLTMCSLLGIPEADAGRIRLWSGAYTLATPVPPVERAELVAEFTAYLREVVAAPRPDAPLLLDLVTPPDTDARLDHDELVSIVRLLVSAGVEAPSGVLGRSVLALLSDDAAHWTALVENRETVLAAVDELLRHVHMGNVAALRVATADVHLPSGTVPAGRAVLLAWIAALHDPDAYDEPDVFRVDRPVRKNIGFGGGRHYCPGVGFARALIAVALDALLDRTPGLRLTVSPDEIVFAERDIGTLVTALPVRLGQRSPGPPR